MRKVVKGRLGDLKFQLNPTMMSHDGGAVWATTSSPSMANPITSYSYGKPEVYSFELWINQSHEQPVNAKKVYKMLDDYRKSKKPVKFTYGSVTKKVVVLECPIDIEAWDSNLEVTELRVPISLQVI